MSSNLYRPPDYTPVSRPTSREPSPVRRIMALRAEALVDRARITAEVANEAFAAHLRLDAGADVFEHAVGRSAGLRRYIQEAGDDPEFYPLHSLFKLASVRLALHLVEGEEEQR